MWPYQGVREPLDLAAEIPRVRDELKRPDIDEFAPYHVGCTHLHMHLDMDEYFAVRVKEDLQARREEFDYGPDRTEIVSITSNIMEDLYRMYSQHKWLPLQTAWPFNLRMVTFVIVFKRQSEATTVADKLVERIRSWGCPVSPYSDGYSEWTKSNSRDVMFNKFCDIAGGRPYPRYSLVTDLHRIGVVVQDDKWLPRRAKWWSRRKSEG